MPCGWVLVDVLTRKIKLRCIKNTVLGTLPILNGKDPDLCQSKKQDPDPYQKGLHQQHWLELEASVEKPFKNTELCYGLCLWTLSAYSGARR
jgi:hypothetical protein